MLPSFLPSACSFGATTRGRGVRPLKRARAALGSYVHISPLYDDCCRLGNAVAGCRIDRNRCEDAGVQNSLEGIEAELEKVERQIAALRETLKRSHAESAAHDAALLQLGSRAGEIMRRPKTWRGGSKSSDAAELEAVRAEIRARKDEMNRSVDAMKSASAEATVLSKRQQDLSKLRADLVARQDQGGPPLVTREEPLPPAAPVPEDVSDTGPPPRFEGGGRSSRRRPE